MVQAGDTIDIDQDDYMGTDALAAWTKDDLLIRGVGGRPHLIADGAYILGKGIWVFVGNNITVENIEFSGATVPDENGAGIRLDGVGMTARHCYFHDNENGILTSNPNDGDILIEYCEFARNGFGGGFTHNLYIGRVNKLVFQYNYSHHTNVGHNLKSRAAVNIIQYNRIMDETTGNSSRLIDLSNGGFALVLGNYLMQGPSAMNNNLIGYGLEGLSNVGPHEFYCINNSMVNKRVASCIFIDLNTDTEVSQVINNIMAGTGTTTQGPITTMSNNLIETEIANVDFVDEMNFDYQLTDTSPAINGGLDLDSAGSYALTPTWIYAHTTNREVRLPSGLIDIGGHEFQHPVGVPHIVTSENSIEVWPNPYTDKVIIDGLFDNYMITVLDESGQVVFDYTGSQSPLTINLSVLNAGMYFILVSNTDFTNLSVHKIVKM